MASFPNEQDKAAGAIPVWQAGSAVVTASDGVVLYLDNLVQTFTYNTDNTLEYIQVTSGGNNYRKSYTYASGLVATISNWVKQ